MKVSTIKRQQEDDGFSSEEDFRQELLFQIQRTKDLRKEDKQQQLDQRLPSQLKDKSYSLHPDILTGWIPRIQLSNPIPLSFHHQELDELLEIVLNNKDINNNIQLCYLGPRYSTTYEAWYEKNFDFPYRHIKQPHSIKFTNRMFCGQLFSAMSQEFIQFDSLFESGNLDAAFKVGDYKYQLFMRVDSNTRGHLQWFNFKVKNMKKGKKYRFSICNFQKGSLLYNKCMKPYIFSNKKYQAQSESWVQSGENVRFSKKQSKVRKQLDKQPQENNKNYMLTFDYLCEYEYDEVQMAYCVPYTYCQMKEFVAKIQSQMQNANIMRVSKLATSLGGLQIPLITITNNIEEFVEAQKSNKRVYKRLIIASARTHPGQSNGSFMIQGFIKFLIGNSKAAQFLRNQIVFKIIPMLNPDGVVLGNYRTGICGKDLNREFIDPDRLVFPEVYSLKQLVREYKQLYGRDLFMFLDFHGHSVKKNVFMYGPQFSLIQKNYYECRIFPKIISIKTQMFRYYSCSFKVSELKESTARGVLFRAFNIPFTYTIQASNGFYYSKQQFKEVQFKHKSWIVVGQRIAQALGDYLEISMEIEKKRIERLNHKKTISQKKQIARQELKQKRKSANRRQMKTSFSFNRKVTIQSIAEQGSAINILSKLKNDKMASLIQEIEKEDEYRHQNHNSEDQISQGISDAQSQSNDLDSSEMKILIDHIKQRTPLKTKKNKKVQSRNDRVNTEVEIIPLQRTATQGIQERQKLVPMRSREYFGKKSYFIKKPSIALTPSPKKEDKGPVAKIMNFNFNLTAIPSRNNDSKLNIDKQRTKLSTKKISYSGTIKEQKLIDQRKMNFRSNQFSQTFHRTFLSVQRQIKRRQNNKISRNPDFLVQNIQGRRITVASLKQ